MWWRCSVQSTQQRTVFSVIGAALADKGRSKILLALTTGRAGLAGGSHISGPWISVIFASSSAAAGVIATRSVPASGAAPINFRPSVARCDGDSRRAGRRRPRRPRRALIRSRLFTDEEYRAAEGV